MKSGGGVRPVSAARAAVLLTALLTGLLTALVALAAPAGAHASLLSADPADGARLTSAPARVTLTFSEPVEAGLGGLRIFDPQGQRADTGQVGHGDGGETTVSVALRPELRPGPYTVAWRITSADSHPIHGAYVFHVGAGTGAAGPAAAALTGDSTAVAVAFGMVRWVGFTAFALLVGPLAVLMLCWPQGLAFRAARRLPAIGWGTSVAATVAAPALQGPYAGGFGLAHALDPMLFGGTLGTRYGTVLTARLALLAVAGVLLAVMLRSSDRHPRPPAPGPVMLTAAAITAVALAATWPAAGHAGAGELVALSLPVDAVHLLAMAVWLGGLVLVAGVLLRRAPEADAEAAIARFSRLAFGCVVLLVATGAYLTWRGVGVPSALLTTPYGRLLLAKLAVVAVLVALGALARSWVRGRTGGASFGRLRRIVAGEVVVATVVLAVTAALVATEPARSAYAAPASRTVVLGGQGAAGGVGSLNVVIDPARHGATTAHLYVLGTDGLPRSVAEAKATLSLPERQVGPLRVVLNYAGPGHYISTGLTVPLHGRWELTVTLRTSDIDQTTVTVPVEIH